MDDNFKIRVDLLKLKGSCVRNLQGQTAVKRCIIIPVDDNPNIYLGEKGGYLNLTAIKMQEEHYTETHCIKGDYPKDYREGLTREQLRELPIFGGMKPIQGRQQPTMQVSGVVPQSAIASDNGDDLPF